MSREAPVEDTVLTPEKLSDILAEATDTDPEEIERGVAEFEIHASVMIERRIAKNARGKPPAVSARWTHTALLARFARYGA